MHLTLSSVEVHAFNMKEKFKLYFVFYGHKLQKVN